VHELTAQGSRLKPAVAEVAQRLGVAKNQLYDRVLKE
jgi:transposase-like protein